MLVPLVAALDFLDPAKVISTFGTIGILAVVFAETGLLIGFFLPGDSLLFTAGLLCATGTSAALHLELGIVVPGVIVAAILGAQVGYLIGRRAGPALFRREDSRLFKRQYVDRAEEFFRKGGIRAVVLARFVPIVRTFLNPAAGISRMPARQFVIANVIGGVLWGGGVTMAGYLLGDVPFVKDHLELVILGIVGLSLLPVAFEVLKNRRERSAVA
ncbi:MAG TPA: VTT domain-containing protein [Acidimicrobiales bacterium]|nr:VTT domain-containing protein [Acidimicrobiales bacterium]